MKKVLNALLFIVSFMWQLPQSLVGLIMLIYFKICGDVHLISYKKLCFAYRSKYMSGGISLGNFAFLSERLAQKEEYIAHEQLGHTWDSKLMGPLYLLIVGLPSLLNAMFDFTECYYDWFPEKWANKHAGLETYTSEYYSKCQIRFKENNEQKQ